MPVFSRWNVWEELRWWFIGCGVPVIKLGSGGGCYTVGLGRLQLERCCVQEVTVLCVDSASYRWPFVNNYGGVGLGRVASECPADGVLGDLVVIRPM